MFPDIKVSFKSPLQIEKEAQEFLRKYHPANNYPIPIEEIIEFQLKLNIIPIPSLHKIFDVDGFLSSDRSSISVDDGIYQSRPGRYRFTLAHEIGHYVLHGEIYAGKFFNKIDEWKVFVETFPEKESSGFEWQANEFAGLVLVPTQHLKKRLAHHKKQITQIGIKDEDVLLDRVIELLAEDFVVSREVIIRRLGRLIKNKETL